MLATIPTLFHWKRPIMTIIFLSPLTFCLKLILDPPPELFCFPLKLGAKARVRGGTNLRRSKLIVTTPHLPPSTFRGTARLHISHMALSLGPHSCYIKRLYISCIIPDCLAYDSRTDTQRFCRHRSEHTNSPSLDLRMLPHSLHLLSPSPESRKGPRNFSLTKIRM